MEYLVVVVS
jgi:glycerate kinase